MTDVVGAVYGTLTVVKEAEKVNGMRRVLAECECGNSKEFYLGNLRMGYTKSCGCRQLEGLAERATTHGGRDTRLYSIWTNIKTRCTNSKTDSYKYYGGKGISICREWEERFEDFRDWALENGYKDDLTIDRMDNEGDYTPDNCRWADHVTQSRNRDYAWHITIDGTTKHVKEWCEYYGIEYKTVHTRKSRGWDDAAAVSTPLLRKRREGGR